MHTFTRRQFVALTAAGVASSHLPLLASPVRGAISAQEIVDRIKKNIGVEWKPDSVDTFKAGDPSTPVTGVVTTSLASLDVLNRAVQAGANFIITSEPTFFSRADTPTPPVSRFPGAPAPNPATPPAPDPVFTAKEQFLKKHNLVVFRLSEQWHMRNPDPFTQGLAEALGWSRYAGGGEAKVLSIPETSLDALVMQVKKSLNSRGGIRVVGNPQLRIRKVALLPGSTPIQASLEALPGVDAIIAGEVREWESVEYVRDTVALGGKKSLTLVGRIVSEGPGMQACAQWLKTIVPEVKSTYIPCGDPYWRPVA